MKGEDMWNEPHSLYGWNLERNEMKGEDMWESPIKQIATEMQMTYENECMKVVQGFGFDVDKEELIKALQYDRKQYEKGYSDGYAKALDEFAEALKEKSEEMFGQKYVDVRDIDEIAEQLKGVQE